MIYKINPEIGHIVKNDSVRIVFFASEKNDVIELVGPVKELFLSFDGSRSVAEIRKLIDSKLSTGLSNDQDFDKMLSYLISSELILNS